jgi:hypothetical protein
MLPHPTPLEPSNTASLRREENKSDTESDADGVRFRFRFFADILRTKFGPDPDPDCGLSARPDFWTFGLGLRD